MLTMGYALEKNELFSVAVRRLTVEQIDQALRHLRAPDANLDRAIHAARQSLKRVRALLVLVRDQLGEKVFEHEWVCYRDIGRLLAGGRDAAVVVETLDALVYRYSSELSGDAFVLERRFLIDRRDAQLRIMIEEERALPRAAELLTAARERVAAWPLQRKGSKAIGEGVRRTYRRGRERLLDATWHPSPTHFHEWRKPVKLLLHQLQILAPIWPTMLNAQAEELHALSDLLNENHDLDLLQAALRSKADTQPPHDRQTFASLIHRRCRQLEVESRQLGRRLYCERPRCFAARLKDYWQVWEREIVTVQLPPADEYLTRWERAEFATRVNQ